MVRELGRHHRRCKGAALDTLWLLISVSFLCFSFCRLSLFLYMDFLLVFRGNGAQGFDLVIFTDASTESRELWVSRQGRHGMAAGGVRLGLV